MGPRDRRLTAAEREKPPLTSDRRLFTARLYDQRGYAITIRSGTHGYYEAETDGDFRWEWEPATYVNITFPCASTTWSTRESPPMVQAVARVWPVGTRTRP
ncbi:SitI3 family protein [Micromonospora sp. NPDC023814]|uniref:SitI3 family protein n=1 Tax=Micromonospora sp. NPDC023814 TaxID=3154596 RepID=UPI0033E4DFDF